MTENEIFTVRSAQLADADTITAFQLAMARETENMELDRVITSKGVHAVFSDPGKGNYIVAESSKTVIACMLTTPEWSDWRNRYILWIQSVYVAPEHRDKGVFKALYHHLMERIKEDPEIGGVRLYVDKSNLQAQEVYSRLGMDGEHYKVFEWMKENQ